MRKRNGDVQLVWALMVVICLSPVDSQKGEGCGKACKSLNDCPGQLICTNGKCRDDPEVPTIICSPHRATRHTSCRSIGRLRGMDPPPHVHCATNNCCTFSQFYRVYDCSPPVSSATPAILSLSNFTEGGDKGGPFTREGKYFEKSEKVAALSTGWYLEGSRCKKMIRIMGNGKSVMARVVDECDSQHGCDTAHAYLPPCKNNVVAASSAVWNALAVPINRQHHPFRVTWSLAS